MARIRFEALGEVSERRPLEVHLPKCKLSEIFGENVFNSAPMRQFLTESALRSVWDAVVHNKKISRHVADSIAAGMKDWAVSKGVTHYTHWFQPLTGASAEKHDAFFELVGGKPIERFSGAMLVQQEPDASSFPSGGIRNTFEARGYTAWDPTSPAFIMGATLCIPTVFISYTGEALDNKTPLLRALQAVDESATSVACYFDRNVKRVNMNLGWEQEYFLIDKALFDSRPDLILTGRTLIGHAPAKGQQLDDHYFGSIPSRAMSFMNELEFECMRLGIPVKTRHNEVAPNQFELAPIFEEANLAVDHNTLIMDLMDKLSRKHHFRVLFHEKPFAGVNGSGKHNNWSLTTDTGVNLLSPGANPKKNLQFLTFFINSIKAVCDYADLIRASVASAGNDHRLGANEAPPAIISVYIGSHLSAVLRELENLPAGKLNPALKTRLKLEVVGKIPEVLLDNTDRNRTSPFAFTGSKFEIRAVGATANCAELTTVLGAILADRLTAFKGEVDTLVAGGKLKKDEAIFNVLRNYIVASKNILFEGDGYSADWKKLAKKRKLNNFKSTPAALKAELSPRAIELFKRNAVLSEIELRARNEIRLRKYSMTLQIEAQTLADMARNHIIPTAITYQNRLIENVRALDDMYGDASKDRTGAQLLLIEKISNAIAVVSQKTDELVQAYTRAQGIANSQKQAEAYSDQVKPIFDEIRKQIDSLEVNVDDELWPITKYRELLFTK
ncbi:MAG: glutamine synthetase III [Flavobacteriales bacterium]